MLMHCKKTIKLYWLVEVKYKCFSFFNMLFKHLYLDFVQTLRPKFENKQMVKCLRDLCGEARQHLWGKDKTQIFKTSLGKQYNYKDKEDKENTDISETTTNNKKRKKSNNDSVAKHSSNTPATNQPLSSTQLNQTCNQFYSQQPTQNAPPMQYPYSTHFNQQPIYQHQQQFNQQSFTQMQQHYFHPQTHPVPTQQPIQQHHLNQQPVPTQHQQQQIQQYDPQPATHNLEKQLNLEHSALSQNDDDTCDFPDKN